MYFLNRIFFIKITKLKAIAIIFSFALLDAPLTYRAPSVCSPILRLGRMSGRKARLKTPVKSQQIASNIKNITLNREGWPW